jgi:hypothetical protein
MKTLSLALVVAVGSLAGCGAPPDGALDDTFVTERAALTTGPFKLHNYQTGLCLGVKAGTPTAGTPVIPWTCDNSANQTWRQGVTAPQDPTFVQLRNDVAEKRCLRHGGGYLSSAFIDECFDIYPQGFTWKPISAGNDLSGHECYRFERFGSPGKVLSVLGGNPSPGATVSLWSDFNDPYGHPDQIWCVY